MKKLSLTLSLTLLLIFAGVSGAACPSMDSTGDCKVTLDDFAGLALQWMTSYDIDDLTIMASEWLTEGIPFDPIFINFQPAASPVPAGYLVDAGDVYGDRGNGYTYGWDTLNAETRDREVDADQRYDTINHMQKDGPSDTWEIEIDNGTYDIDIVLGDPANIDHTNHVMLEDVLLVDPDGEDAIDEHFGIIVVVSDGKLTVTPSTTAPNIADNAKICYIDIVLAPPDFDPPTPNPATFAVAPSAISDSAISMTATIGTDASGPVEYYFDETSGNPGGTDSGWQTSASYTDSGLDAETQYTYTVQMRDSLLNTGTASSAASGTTLSSEVLLEENDTQNDKIDIKDGQKGAQSFKHGSGSDLDYQISKVELKLSRDSDSPNQDLVFSIGTSANGGTISGSTFDISPSSVTNSSGGSSFMIYTITFSTPVGSLSPNTTYYLNFETGGNGKAYFLGYNGDSDYDDGSYYKDGSNDSKDSYFKIFGSDISVVDINPPTPNPATFAVAPAADSDTAISMTATTASDVSGVEYYFTCTAGGGNDSGWQSSTSYEDTGLSASTQYTYTVKARDLSSNQNETAASAGASATTAPPDLTAPTPDPMTFAVPPAATSATSIEMTATTAGDPSGVEYYFACTAGGGNDSGWQDSTSYEDTGLSPNTQYTYTVTARDKSASQNATAPSSAASAITSNNNIYYNAALAYAEAMIDDIRDVYGSQYTPLFGAVANRFTHVVESGMPPSVEGLRENDRSPGGANPMDNVDLYYILYRLTDETGNTMYAQEADAALEWFFNNTQSPQTDLMAWGEHLSWNFYTEAAGGYYTHHEYGDLWPLWDEVYRLTPQAGFDFAMGVWDHQIANHTTGRYNRHANYFTHGPAIGSEYPRHGGYYIQTWANAYQQSTDATYKNTLATAIEVMIDGFNGKRDPVTDAIPQDWDSTGYWPTSNLELAIGVWEASVILEAEGLTTLAAECSSFAALTDAVYQAVPHELYSGGRGFIDNTRIYDFSAVMEWTPMWENAYGGCINAEVAVFCKGRYDQIHLVSGLETIAQGYKDLILDTADMYLTSDPDTSSELWPRGIARVIRLLIAAYEIADPAEKQAYLDRAYFMGDQAMLIFLDGTSPLPKASSQTTHYEAMTGGPALMRALMELSGVQ